MSDRRVYLDYNATAPLRPEARAAMTSAMDAVGNPSSVHREGREARRVVEAARGKVAALVGADPRRVAFTSGGTEANNAALSTTLLLGGKPVGMTTLLCGATEHPSVRAGGRFADADVVLLPVDGHGIVDIEALAARLEQCRAEGGRAVVSVMAANNETGAIQPVAEIARIAHAHGAVVHSDATQAIGRMPVTLEGLGVDLLTMSAHKLGGPQGVGALVTRSADIDVPPLVRGGGQERGRRAGTENVLAIAGFGAAAEAATRDLALAPRWRVWRDHIAEGARQVAPTVVFSEGAERLPQTICLGLPGMSAETLVIGLDLEGVAVSSGSACSSGKVGPSHVLAAMGIAAPLARSAVRVSFGWETVETDLDMFQSAWRRVVGRIRHADSGKAA